MKAGDNVIIIDEIFGHGLTIGNVYPIKAITEAGNILIVGEDGILYLLSKSEVILDREVWDTDYLDHLTKLQTPEEQI